MLSTLVRRARITGIGNFAMQVGRNERLDRSAASANDTNMVLGKDLFSSLTHTSCQHHSYTFGL